MPTPTGRVIEGNVAAAAGDASVAVNNRAVEAIPVESRPTPAPFFYREVTHNRVTPVLQGEQIVLNMVSLVERVPEGGAWPEGIARYQGLGRIDAQTPLGPIQRNYRFDVPGHNIDEAWANFDSAAKVGAVGAENQLRAEVARAMHEQAGKIAIPTPAQAARIVGADGRPIG